MKGQVGMFRLRETKKQPELTLSWTLAAVGFASSGGGVPAFDMFMGFGGKSVRCPGKGRPTDMN